MISVCNDTREVAHGTERLKHKFENGKEEEEEWRATLIRLARIQRGWLFMCPLGTTTTTNVVNMFSFLIKWHAANKF